MSFLVSHILGVVAELSAIGFIKFIPFRGVIIPWLINSSSDSSEFIGYGSSHKQDTAEAYGEPRGDDEIKLNKRAYGWPEDSRVLVPDGVREHILRMESAGAAKVDTQPAGLEQFSVFASRIGFCHEQSKVAILPRTDIQCNVAVAQWHGIIFVCPQRRPSHVIAGNERRLPVFGAAIAMVISEKKVRTACKEIVLIPLNSDFLDAPKPIPD